MIKGLLSIAITAGNIFVELWWFIVVAILIASIMSTLKLDKSVAQMLNRAGAWAIVGALLLGLVSPL
jgi:uncharacterized membrane protein YraQ (UPF0718 family)